MKTLHLKDFYKFIITNFRKLSFGWILTFLSSFGQTFLISLYVPEIIKAFSISEGTFGAIYAGCTVTASIIMLTVGHTVDHKPAKTVTAFSITGLAIATILLGFSYYFIPLIIAIIMLRLFGQGLLTHISMTLISKIFDKNRGKALSFSSLGFSIGEAILPILITTIIAFYNWRVAAIGSGALLLLYLVKLKFTNLKHFDDKLISIKGNTTKKLVNNYKEIIFNKKFGILMPAVFAVSFINTAVFFYQYIFVEQKEWSATLYASFFTAYAITRLVFSLFGGVWVDKYTAKKLFRFYLIPLNIGLLPFAFMDSIIGALAFLILAGITTGISGTVKTAIIAEVYGTENLGAIRSIFTMFMVISTALGPLIVGFLIDHDFSVSHILLILSIILCIVVFNSQRINRI
ncbi:MFS transporter [Zunongwangia endophytica]|uniref:MFS transporter n=1 Tax=Zunongwangia endophytica TaxID=1808945 RepID=A0ABV8H7K2_9FLAO|nr:MFS transporter [Zunongwangia endophytica]MDN3593885.1 MFS transporter [Zunongwangia endophytica]